MASFNLFNFKTNFNIIYRKHFQLLKPIFQILSNLLKNFSIIKLFNKIDEREWIFKNDDISKFSKVFGILQTISLFSFHKGRQSVTWLFKDGICFEILLQMSFKMSSACKDILMYFLQIYNVSCSYILVLFITIWQYARTKMKTDVYNAYLKYE